MPTTLDIRTDTHPLTYPLDPIFMTLAMRGADRQGHGRGTVMRHLEGTHAILTGWGQPERVCLAGLMHNVYSTDGFVGALFRPSERGTVQSLIGDEAERLVHLFGGLSREELFRAIAAAKPQDNPTLRLPDRRGGPELILGTRDIGDLLVLYLANVADQACMRDGGPTYWLAAASELACLAASRSGAVPPVLDHCHATVSIAAEEAGLEAYDTALRIVARDRSGAIARLDEAARRLRWLGEPMILRGMLHSAAGDAAAARIAAGQGAKRMLIWGTPWDKRLSLSEWQHLARTVASVGIAEVPAPPTASSALSLAISAAFDAVTASPRDLLLALDKALANTAEAPKKVVGDAEADRLTMPQRFCDYIARRNEGPENKAGGFGIYPGLSAKPWHPAETVPLATDLEASAEVIAQEFAALPDEVFADEAEDIARTGRWSVLFLEKDGVKRQAICARCPATAAVLDRHRAEIDGAGVAYFSRLDPETRIAPHRGATNTRLRLHLGIKIPTECGMSVGGVRNIWREGRCLVFDDSFIHSVWNDSSHSRVVLIVDLWHPDLSQHEVSLLKWLAG